MEKKQGIGFFERYLTIWVALCIVIGMAIGQYLPAIPQTLSKFEYANVSIPVAILIWLMIYPMMLKVDFQSIKKLLIIPVISTFVVGIVMLCVVSVPMAWLNQGLTGFIDGLGTQNLVLTGMVIGGMMAVDLGGPINKVAYTFAVAAISNGNYYPMAAAMVGGVVPPLGVALATTLFKKKFTKDQQIQGKTYYLLGASFITESCMPVALTDPVRMIPAGIIGSAVAGGLAMLFQISLPAPHGGIFVTPVVEGAISQKLLYLAAIAIGMLVSALIIGFTRKPLKEQEA